MDLKLEGKTALVSGSTVGIGLAIARALAQEGAIVTVNGRSEVRVRTAIDSIQQTTPTAKLTGIVADLGTKAGTETLFHQLPSVDIVVNNLGPYEPKSFNDITDREWFNSFEVNVLSGIRLSRRYLPQMLKRNWGRIVFISSIDALAIRADSIHYDMTKTAQLAIARGLAETTARTGVTVNSVLPGPTRSEAGEDFLGTMASDKGVDKAEVEKEYIQTVYPTSLLQRFATSEEVAAMTVYLCSPLSSATNGAAVRVDGGAVRSIV
jgi:NAD(P)-dependent dehydrogenase (short-subunit alcohol dehydrogenase family)